MRCLLTEDMNSFGGGRGLLLPSCNVCVQLIARLHSTTTMIELAGTLAQKSSELLLLVDKYLINEFEVGSQSDDTFDFTWLEPLMGTVYSFMQTRSSRHSWQLAQLATVFSMHCRFVRIFDQGHLSCIPDYRPSHRDDARFRHLVLNLLENINSHRDLLEENTWLAEFRDPLQGFFVAFFDSDHLEDIEAQLEDTIVPRSLWQYMLQHWDAPHAANSSAMSSLAGDSPVADNFATRYPAGKSSTRPHATHSPAINPSATKLPVVEPPIEPPAAVSPVTTSFAGDPSVTGPPAVCYTVASPSVADRSAVDCSTSDLAVAPSVPAEITGA
jgi:hypothetical protein